MTVEEDPDMYITPDPEPDPEPDLDPDLGKSGQTGIYRSDEAESTFRRGLIHEQELGGVGKVVKPLNQVSEKPEDNSQTETVVDEAVDGDEEDDQAEDDDDGVPIDRGWAWMTVLGTYDYKKSVKPHRDMKWGDVTLQTDGDGKEFLMFTERQSKTCQGDNPQTMRDVQPKLSKHVHVCLFVAFFFNLFIMVGYMKALGVLFVEFLEIYRASVTMTTLLMGTMSATYSIASFFTMQVVLVQLDTRKTIILGGIMSSAGITLSYFADSVVFLICMQGVVLGIGQALINGPGIILISEYFKKRRGIATSIAICGISFGSAFPPFVNYLLEEFTLRDTFLILGAIHLNIIVGGMLSRPVSFYKKSHARKKLLLEDIMADSLHAKKRLLSGDKTEETFKHVSKTERKHLKAINATENYSNNCSCLVAKSLDHLPIDKSLQTLEACRKRTFSDSMTYRPRTCKNQDTLTRPTLLFLSSDLEIGPVSLVDLASRELAGSSKLNIALTVNCQHDSAINPCINLIKGEHDSATNSGIGLMNTEHNSGTNSGIRLTSSEYDDCTNPGISLMNEHPDPIIQDKSNHIITEPRTGSSMFHRILQLVKKPFTSLDFSVFKNPLFSMFACAAIFNIQTQSQLTYVPALAIEHGISQSNAALLLTISGAMDLLSKLAFGWFADLGVIRKHHLQMMGLCINATSSLFVSLYSSFPLMVGYTVIQGIFSGVYRSLYVHVLIDFVGTENMGKAFGIIQLIHGLMVAVAHPVIGSLRDFTGSYSASFQYTAACGFVGSSILLLERWARRKKNQIRNTSSKS
ncbi:uncharacterized protein LOC121378885 [Gigantopelta aegis]|uniref:uncharacterized protein LOC121378885 n=1 Tax=Gigantopelta aegis TaxID=1735272 RepID=UPI001B887F10|nr:uncharacterized protein LOC121378885 [Gigantopelta aegis]